ncbi:hypothetical protein KBC04_02855 [Candidatus Babeliales bacterium]|nr:hypothetical protein [Candidatus Babeliales bacterium]MBP9844007.1 hypothetical protein [Candidatus Babeliales bacterium]
MKIFDGQFNNQIIVICLMLHGLLSARNDGPSNLLPAYSNQISQISYSVASDDRLAITFVCKHDPICMYTPLRYEDIAEDSLTKTYFLPRTKCVDSQMRYFYEELQGSLRKVGVDLKIEEIKDFQYGLRMSFTMQPDAQYDIVKVIDTEKNLIRFNIIGKI